MEDEEKIVLGFVFGMISVFAFIPQVEAKEIFVNDLAYGNLGQVNCVNVFVGDSIVYQGNIVASMSIRKNENYFGVVKYDQWQGYIIKSYEEIFGEELPEGKKASIEFCYTVGSGDTGEVNIYYTLVDDVQKEVVYHNTFDAENNNPLTYYEGETTILLNDISRDGYRFLGWYTSPTFEEDTRVTMISSDAPEVLELYARWEEIEEEKENMTNPNTRTMLYVGIGLAIVVVLGTVLVVLYRKKKNHEKENK